MCMHMSDPDRRKNVHEPVSLALADDCRSLSPPRFDRVVDYVFSHSMESIKGFLKDTELKVWGKRKSSEPGVQDAIDNGKTDISALVNLLDTIEGWGNQHVYLYQSPDGETNSGDRRHLPESEWRRSARINFLIGGGPWCCRISRRCRPLNGPPIAFALFGSRSESGSYDAEDLRSRRAHRCNSTKAYGEKLARGITSFDWNLAAGEAASMIQQLPSGERYDEIRQRYEQSIEDAVHVSNFTRRDVRKAIHGINLHRRRRSDKSPSKRNVRPAFRSPAGAGIGMFTMTLI